MKISKDSTIRFGTMKEVTFRKKLKQGLQATRKEGQANDPMGLHQHLEIHLEYLGGQ